VAGSVWVKESSTSWSCYSLKTGKAAQPSGQMHPDTQQLLGGYGRTSSLWPLAEGGGKLFCEDLKRGVWESPREEQQLPL